MLFVTFYSSIVFSQKIISPKIQHIQNNSVIVLPLNKETIKSYESKYKNYSIIPYSTKSHQIDNSLSYTITNATITVIDKMIYGKTKVDSISPKQTVVIPDSKIINGKNK